MKHPIDPKVDCVFKALLGRDENRDLLIHFLNAVLGGELPRPIVWVQLADKDNDREYLADKLSVVDVKAGGGRSGADLPDRSADAELRASAPAHRLYLVRYLRRAATERAGLFPPTSDLFDLVAGGKPAARRPAPCPQLQAARCGRPGAGGQRRHLLVRAGEVPGRAGPVGDEAERWLKFFKEGGELDDAALPGWMDTPEMRKAMSILTQFSEKEENYHRYQARMNFLREQRTIQWEYEQGLAEALERERAALMEKERERVEKEAALAEKERERAEKEAALAEKEREQAEKEAALAEIERLKALLAGKP